jgi:penicillin-binding protein 1A
MGKKLNNAGQKRAGKRQSNSSSRAREKSKSGWPLWLRWGLKIFLAIFILVFLLFLITYLGFLGKVPSGEELSRFKSPVASEVLSQDGKVLGRYYIENRSNVTYKEISKNVVNALIATEDVRFFRHRGIDEVALIRVFFKSLLLGDRSSGGGSTLSQQIAKNIFPRKDYGIMTLPVSKIRETIIAYRLERIYTKEEILTLYLNTVPFGENIFGIEIAAERYFNKTPKDLTIPEAAVLIGMLKANQVFNPRLHPEKSLERRNVVIDLMVKNKFITAFQGGKFKQSPLNLHYSLITYNQGPAPYFMEYLRPVLMKWCSDHNKENGDPYNLFTDGLKIYVSLDFNLQRYATEAVRNHMKSVQSVFDSQWKTVKPWSENKSILERAVKRTDRYKNGLEAGKSHQEIMKEFSKPIMTSLFTWDGLDQVKTTPLDSLKHYLQLLNAGCLVLENGTGAIKAWVGGIDYRFFKYDYCNAGRQIGSTFKPVVYLAALEKGLSPLKHYSSEQKVYRDYDNWSPSNATEEYSGYYSMKAALAHSINTVSVDIMMQTGIDNVIQTARNLGLKADLPEVPSLALGTASVSLRDMVSAYAAMANLGSTVQPWALRKIENSRGALLETFEKPEPGEAKVDPENCRILIEMLRAVVESGTGSGLRTKFNVPGDMAGKTGTTQDHADGWFIGISPDYTAGCWVGGDDPAIHFRNLQYGQGAYMALPVVGKFFSQMYADSRFKGLLNHHFESPDSLTLIKLNELPDNVASIDDDFNFFHFIKNKIRKTDTGESRSKDVKKPSGEKNEEPVWEKIRRIFRKTESR